MNVKTAFLYETLNDDIYIKMLIEFEEFDKVCKLNKVFYNFK